LISPLQLAVGAHLDRHQEKLCLPEGLGSFEQLRNRQRAAVAEEPVDRMVDRR
jgi:hypothetical protein